MLIVLYCLHFLFVEANACAFYNLHETLGILAVNSAIRVTVPDLDLPTSPLWAYQWFLKTGGGGGGRVAGGDAWDEGGKVTPLSSVVKFPLHSERRESQRV